MANDEKRVPQANRLEQLIELELPGVGDGGGAVNLDRWMVPVGDAVRREQSLVALSTDKASFELPSPVDGRLVSTLVEAGQIVAPHTVLALLATPPEPAWIADAFLLWSLTGWNDGYRLSEEEFVRSWQSSPVKKALFVEDRLVAIGRANTDGVVYAMIYDVVVHPDERGQGFGRRIVQDLLRELDGMGIRVIQLMSAVGQTGFYEKLGFESRPSGGPGMQRLRRFDDE